LAVEADQFLGEPAAAPGIVGHQQNPFPAWSFNCPARNEGLQRHNRMSNPLGCDYQARKTEGYRQTAHNTIGISVRNVASTPEAAKKYFDVAQKGGGADTPLDGLGDQARIDVMNQIYIRKGVLVVTVRVGGGERDQALHADARRRVNELAKLVAAKLP
jgi:hypothetical protein